MAIDLSALAAILAALSDGPLLRTGLEARLQARGQAGALEHLVDLLKAGQVGAVDLEDDDGHHFDTLFFTPEDAAWVLYGSFPS